MHFGTSAIKIYSNEKKASLSWEVRLGRIFCLWFLFQLHWGCGAFIFMVRYGV